MVQILVDIGTDPKLLDQVQEVAKKVAADNPKDFKPNPSVTAQIASEKDPLKFVMQVYWCFQYNGETFTIFLFKRKFACLKGLAKNESAKVQSLLAYQLDFFPN